MRPRALKKVKLPVNSLKALTPEKRAAFLVLGLFLNEANWLRKILVTAVLGMTDTVEGQASFALTTLTATTLAGKIFEGWDIWKNGWLRDALADTDMPDDLKMLHDQLATALTGNTLVRIRNNIAFHYPHKPLDFKKLADHIGEDEAYLLVAPEGYGGDMLSQLSTFAGIEPLVAISKNGDYRVALKEIWEEVANVAGLYCRVVSDMIAVFIKTHLPDVMVEDILIPSAPDADETSIRFFVHPPSDIEEMRAEVQKADGGKAHP